MMQKVQIIGKYKVHFCTFITFAMRLDFYLTGSFEAQILLDEKIILLYCYSRGCKYRIEICAAATLKNKQKVGVKEMFKTSNPMITVHDVSIHANMLVYSTNDSKTGGNYLTLVNLEPQKLLF